MTVLVCFSLCDVITLATNYLKRWPIHDAVVQQQFYNLLEKEDLYDLDHEEDILTPFL